MVMAEEIEKSDDQEQVIPSGMPGLTLTNQEQVEMFNREMMSLNATLLRTDLMRTLIDPRRSINEECGYPDTLTISDYQTMYEREGLATKVVSVLPNESWVVDPLIQEDDEADQTEFEESWVELEDEHQLNSVMFKADEISGIGRFGIILLGFDDNQPLNKPLEGINDDGTGSETNNHQLLFTRTFSEAVTTVKAIETKTDSPRFGKPTMYTVNYQDINAASGSSAVGKETDVHWTRAIHIADNTKESEIFGMPRMQTLFNRLYDLRKITSGSGEMFWKGGFPGINFEMDPNAKPMTDPQKAAFRTEVANYANGLQRYMTLQGIKADNLNPNIADPESHYDIQVRYISTSLDVPKRIFEGSERGELASSQDLIVFNMRIQRRQNKYLTPFVVKRLVNRLIAAGTLPAPEQYTVIWPDLNAPSEKDKAEVMGIYAKGFAEYVRGDVDEFIEPKIFLKLFAGLSQEQVDAIEEASDEFHKDDEDTEEADAMLEERERKLGEKEDE
jgi:hypothetical protein